MSTHLEIRSCRDDDLRNLEWDGLFTHHRDIFARTFAEQRAGRQVMLVAELDGRAVGQAWIDVHSSAARGIGIIWAVRVHPAQQGRGIGARLIDAAERVLRERGFDMAQLAVEVANTRARLLYERLGYVLDRQSTHTSRYTTPAGELVTEHMDVFEMQKSLAVEASAPVIRWTIGNVSPAGFEALRLSVWGAHKLFGPRAAYVVCVNSVALDVARQLTGDTPSTLEWRSVTRGDLADFVRPHLDDEMAEGVGWKFAPFRVFDGRPELALDNDCILWELPPALHRWATADPADTRVVAEDVVACFGQFAPLCGDRPRNSGIRAVPAHFDLEARMRATLARIPCVMRSELDEQGLQIAAMSLDGEPQIVHVDEVSICSPFAPHLPHLGRYGAHFVGVNARALPWSLDGRPATAYLQEHWRRWRAEVAARVGVGLRSS